MPKREPEICLQSCSSPSHPISSFSLLLLSCWSYLSQNKYLFLLLRSRCSLNCSCSAASALLPLSCCICSFDLIRIPICTTTHNYFRFSFSLHHCSHLPTVKAVSQAYYSCDHRLCSPFSLSSVSPIPHFPVCIGLFAGHLFQLYRRFHSNQIPEIHPRTTFSIAIFYPSVHNLL